MKFTELHLEPELQQAIDKSGFADCTPIQALALPPILEGRDVAGLAQTGTGKTAAFLIPLMDRILKARHAKVETTSETADSAATTATTDVRRRFSEWRAGQFILILVPTRELAEQVAEKVQELGSISGLKGFPIYGGTGYDKQKEAIRGGLDFVIATPGRLIDLYKEHVLDLKQVRAVVFDEADRMFDMGFKDDMKYILQRIPGERQFLVFSATLNFDVLNTAYQFGADPVEIDVSRDQTKAENVKDQIYHVGHDEKPQFLMSILKKNNPKQAIIFSNFKHNVERVVQFLTSNGIPAVGISSLLTQAQRNRVIEQFKNSGDQQIVLVATDVAARGLDIKGVDMVINYELPQDAESYVHRIGRTGRAGAEGHAFSLVGDQDVESLGRIEEYLKHKVDAGWFEDQDLVKDFKPFPTSHGYSGERGPRGSSRGGDRNDRGPRRERGPRQDSRHDRRDRPERGDRSGGGAEHRADRNDRGARNERPQRSGEHGSSSRQNGSHENKPRHSQHARPANGKQPGRPSHQKGSHTNRSQHSKSHRQVKPVVAQKSLGAKVKSFFKKIFAGG